MQLNPLRSLGCHEETEASMPFCYSELAEVEFWAVRRNCRYEITAGMLPEIDSVCIAEVDEVQFHAFADDRRKIALAEILDVLKVDIDDIELMNLNEHMTGNTLIAITDNWHILIQSDFDSFEIEEKPCTQMIINYMVMLR